MDELKYTTFGQRLRELRLAKGWSQRDLARRSGLDKMLIEYYEDERHEPRIFSALCLADALGTSLDYLIAGRGEPHNIN